MSSETPRILDAFEDEDWIRARMDALLAELKSDEARYRVREAVQLEIADRGGDR